MPKNVNKVIISIERTIAREVDFDKYIKQLREFNKLDALLNIKVAINNSKPEEKYSLLMFFVIQNNYDKVKNLLEGENSASPLIANDVGESALYLAVLVACSNSGYDIRIIDELLKYNPEQQVSLQIKTGETPLFLAVKNKNISIIRKLTTINNSEQFLKKANITLVTPLCYAVEKELPISIIDELLKQYQREQLLCPNAQGMIPLSWALYRGNIEIARRLMSFFPREQLIHKTKDNASTLHSALMSKNYELIEFLVRTYPFCLNLKTTDNLTLLHIACSKIRDLKLVRLLLVLENGAQSQVTVSHDEEKEGFIPLSGVCEVNEPLIANELLKFQPEAQLRHLEPQGFTALLSACYYGSLEVLSVLVQTINRLNLDPKEFFLLKDKTGYSVLHIAVSNPHNVKNYRLEIIDKLLEYLATEQLEEIEQNDDGRTALFIAVEKNNVNAVKKLTEYPNKNQFLQPNNRGAIPLYHAIQESYFDIVKILLSQHASEQLIVTFEGWLPIHIASKAGHLGIFNTLVKYDNSQLLVKDAEGRTPLHLAVEFKHRFIIQALLNFYKVDRLIADNYNLLPIHYACQNGDIDSIKNLLSEKPDKQLFAKTESGSIPFHSAVIANAGNTVKFFLETYTNEKNWLLSETDNQDCTALHLASVYGHLEIVKILITNKANINAADIKGYTPLHMACFKGHISIVRYLVSQGANLSAINDLKATPLHIACERGYSEVVEELIKSDVSPDMKDCYSRTGLVCAVAFGYTDIVDMLAKKGANVNIIIEICEHAITPLRIAVENLDLEMVKILIKYHANPDQILKDGREIITLFEVVKNFVDDPELKPLFLESLKSENITISIQKESIQQPEILPLERRELSSRKYLESIGYTQEQIQEWDEERKEAKHKLKKSLRISSNVSVSNETSIEYTWFNQSFSYNHESILPIFNSSTKGDAYCYLDKVLLQEQGCNIDGLGDLHLKFGHKHIKKLDDAKGIYKNFVRFPDRETEIKYTHELKINGQDRILLFDLPSDNKDACLYVGTRYISEGFHVKAKIRSAELSGKTCGVLKVNWPTSPGWKKTKNSLGNSIKYSLRRTLMPPSTSKSILGQSQINFNLDYNALFKAAGSNAKCN
jgi:ankyrin repeat protein